MEKATREEENKKRYEVKIEIPKARKTRRKRCGYTKDAKGPHPPPPIKDMLRQRYLQYKRSRSTMTWPP